jgi:hypothetical protein
MKKIILLSTSFLMIIFFSGSSIEATWNIAPAFSSYTARANPQKDKRVHKEFSVKSGQLLDLDLRTGATINIKGWDKDIVSIDAELGGNDWEDVNLNFNQSSSGVAATSDYEGSRNNRSSKIEVTIKVPKKFDLKFETMGGAVTLNNIEGEMKGTTMGGPLNLSYLKGNLTLKTMGGPITLTDSDVDGKVSTMGGKVSIENVVGNVDGSSMGGNVTIKNLKRRDGTSIGKETHISTMGGAIELNNAPFGADVQTMGGDITINSADKFVKAKTMGGNILIKSVNGSVKATTMGGNIGITETGTGDNKDIELKSMSGDITLVVPADFSMDINSQITYNQDESGKYKIHSDFSLNESTAQKEKNNGWRKTEVLTGTGIFNGGNNKVKISTIAGDIYIKKAK